MPVGTLKALRAPDVISDGNGLNGKIYKVFADG